MSDSDFDWDDFASDRMAFDNIGDEIVGKVVRRRKEQGKSGELPVVTLQTDAQGTEREVWAGAADLKAQLAHAKPGIGDLVRIKFVGEKQTGQASPMKLFEVKIKPADTQTEAPAPPPVEVSAWPDDEEPF